MVVRLVAASLGRYIPSLLGWPSSFVIKKTAPVFAVHSHPSKRCGVAQINLPRHRLPTDCPFPSHPCRHRPLSAVPPAALPPTVPLKPLADPSRTCPRPPRGPASYRSASSYTGFRLIGKPSNLLVFPLILGGGWTPAHGQSLISLRPECSVHLGFIELISLSAANPLTIGYSLVGRKYICSAAILILRLLDSLVCDLQTIMC